jgi:hypothetical protein
MPSSPNLPPGTDLAGDTPETPDFRDWLSDPANQPEADALVARFILDDGVEMTLDLIGSTGQQHQWTAERWINKLGDDFERWWASGRPRVTSDKIKFAYITTALEQDAHALLDQNLPPQAVYTVAQRRRRSSVGGSEALAWFCRIEDGAASSGGQGATPLAAARAALAAWREFVTGSRVEIVEAAPPERPPLLDAPSSDNSAAPDVDAGKRAV